MQPEKVISDGIHPLRMVTKFNEEELISGLYNKDQFVFSYLYDNYAATLYNVIYMHLRDKSQSDDLLQEVFVKIWNNFSLYDRTKGRLFTWLICLTKNMAIDALRGKEHKGQKRTVYNDYCFEERDNNCVFKKFDSLRIQKYLVVLSPDKFNLIKLAYYSGMTQIEISRHTKLPLGTVKTKLRKAILELRKMLDD